MTKRDTNSSARPASERAPAANEVERVRRRFVALTLAPAFGLMGGMAALSMGMAIWLSLQNRTLLRPDSSFVGLYNYRRVFEDPRFLNALEISLLWQVITVFGTIALAILISVLIYENVKRPAIKAALSLLFLMPVLLPRVAAAFVWRFFYAPSNGLLNYLLGLVGLGPFEFLSSPSLALGAVAMVDIWQWGLFFSVIVLRLLETLPKEPIEAARLDDAKAWEIHAYITLPMLRTAIVSLLFVKAVESLRSFDLIFVMTGGGPGIATETLDLYAYQVGINLGGRISYASAMSLLLLVATIVGLTIIWKGVRRWAAD